MKNTVLFLIAIMGCYMAAHAQSEAEPTPKSQAVTYVYDLNGNRTNRSFVILKASTTDTTTLKNLAKEEFLSQGKLIVYPNPVKESLQIEWVCETGSTTGTIEMADLSGKLLHKMVLKQGINILPMQHYKPATYIIGITADGQVSTWKIIKE